MPVQAVFAPEPWFDTSDSSYAIVGANSLIQLNVQYESIKDLIVRLSKEYGVSPTLALKIARCESSLDPTGVGDRGKSRGLWQIHKGYFPYITDLQAFDPEWSTRWSLEKIKNNEDIWSCWK